jgi:hypothetical protein
VRQPLTCVPFAEGRLSRDGIETFHVELDLDASSTEAGDSSIEVKGKKPQLLVPACAGARVALLSGGSSDDLDSLNRTPTTRTSTKRFERPNYFHVFAHVVFCCASYPIIYAGTVAAKDTSIFWARVIVGLWCSGIGITIGWSLVVFATMYAEAASKHISRFFCTPRVPDSVLTGFCKAWATVIHLSHSDDGPGIKLKELAYNSHQPESAMSGFRLLWTRFSNRGTDRRARKAIECVFHPSIY